MSSNKTVLVTGAAGFIGFHFSQRLLSEGYRVFGIDNLNDYYDVSLKHGRLELLQRNDRFQFQQLDLADRDAVSQLFASQNFTIVVNLAAQAGVRYSLQNPAAYIDSNLVGFANILEGCRHHPVEHLVFASSSSVYGGNTKVPFATSDPVDRPVSLYAASKKAKQNLMELQPGDVLATYADVSDLMEDVGFKPSTPLEEGLTKFVEWYRNYYST